MRPQNDVARKEDDSPKKILAITGVAVLIVLIGGLISKRQKSKV